MMRTRKRFPVMGVCSLILNLSLANPPPENSPFGSQALQEAQLALNRRWSSHASFSGAEATLFAHDTWWTAVAFRMTGNDRYKTLAQQRLIQAARGWNPKDPWITSNDSLDFCVALIPMLMAYQELRPTFTRFQRKRLETRFFIPAGALVRLNAYNRDDRQRRSNHRSWQNAAVGAVGGVTHREDLLTWALQDPHGGFYWQMQNSFGHDGLHWEGSPRYQLYAMAAHVALAETLRKENGPNLWQYRSPQGFHLATLFAGLLQIAESQGRLPNINARRQESLYSFAPLYALAYQETHQPDFAWVALQKRPEVSDRPWTYAVDGEAALRGWPQDLHPTPPVLASAVKADVGWAVFRAGQTAHLGDADPMYVLFKYSRFKALGAGAGTAHEHADKGLLEIRAHGIQWLAARSRQDSKEPLYASFDRQTVAKNTVVVDQTSQPGAKSAFDSAGASGKLEWSWIGHRIQVLQARNDAAYEMPYCRMIALIGAGEDGVPPYVIDFFDVTDTKPHTYDYVLRAGEEDLRFLRTSLPQREPGDLGRSIPGYGALTETFASTPGGPFCVGWGNATGGYYAHVLWPVQKTTLYQSLAPGITPDSTFPHVIVRQRGLPGVQYRVIHEIFQGNPRLKPALVALSPGYTALEVMGPAHRDLFVVRSSSAGTTRTQIGNERITLQGRWGFIRQKKGTLRIEGDIHALSLRAFGGSPLIRALDGEQPIKPSRKGSFIEWHREVQHDKITRY